MTGEPTSSPATASPTRVYADAFTTLDRPVSLPRFVFLDPRARVFYRRWDGLAEATVGSLRAPKRPEIPYDADLTPAHR